MKGILCGSVSGALNLGFVSLGIATLDSYPLGIGILLHKLKTKKLYFPVNMSKDESALFNYFNYFVK